MQQNTENYYGGGEGLLPLRDTVFQQIRIKILQGEFKPGERLMEIALSDTLGVSRTPVREAIRMLEKEGLVEILPRRGARVAGIRRDILEDVIGLRSRIESMTAFQAAARMGDKELVELRKINQEMLSAIKGERDCYEVAGIDTGFHQKIASFTGSRMMMALMEQYRDQFFRFKYEYLKAADDWMPIYLEHAAMLEAFSKKDGAGARDLSKLHVERTGLLLYQGLSSNNKEERP